MNASISCSVGFAGGNRRPDVTLVQTLLNRVPPEKGGPVVPLVVDGICGNLVVAAIQRFQKAIHSYVDGRVDPNGPTLAALQQFDVPHPQKHEVNAISLADAVSSGMLATPVGGGSSYSWSRGATGGMGLPAGVPADRWKWWKDAVLALERLLMGSATQSWGWIIWGESKDGKGSTAAKLSSGGKIYRTFDYKKFRAETDTLLMVFPVGTNYRDFVKDLADGLDSKDPQKAATAIFEAKGKIEDIQKQFAGEPKVEAEAEAAEKKKVAARTEVAQWVAYDGSGNQYVKIRYSDRTTEFYFGWRGGYQKIDDPGETDWRLVKGKGRSTAEF